jgi:hypothetical protein
MDKAPGLEPGQVPEPCVAHDRHAEVWWQSSLLHELPDSDYAGRLHRVCARRVAHTRTNGATAIIPFSQRNIAWPDEAHFDRTYNLVTGQRGTVLLFTGLLQHGSTANASTIKRTSVLAQYLPKYVRPMEDMDQVGDAVRWAWPCASYVRKRATPRMKQLLGEHTPYPKVCRVGVRVGLGLG